MSSRWTFLPRAAVAAAVFLATEVPPPAFAEAQDLLPHLRETFQTERWNEAIQTASEILRRNPNHTEARLRGAFALFQRGYPTAALNLLKRIPAGEWKQVPADLKPLVEVVALFQKKVPIISLPARIDQLNEAEASSFLHDEIRFAKGRAAFEKADYLTAKSTLAQVSNGSRFFGSANYLLGSIAVHENDYDLATAHFSRTFDPQVMQQSTEFWGDLGPQGSTQFGTALNVLMDTESLRKTNSVAELSVMAIARILYAKKRFAEAITQYEKIQRSSALFGNARMELVWSLLQMEEHEKAQKAAADLSVDSALFESLEAGPVRALILTDSGKPTQGREALRRFLEDYAKSKEALTRYRQFPNPATLPEYIKSDLKRDKRIEAISRYQVSLKQEIERLRGENRVLFGAYAQMSEEMEPLVTQAKQYSDQLTIEHVDRRLKDLERLYIQARLITAETYLEERERLRETFRNKGVTEASQDEHDRQLVKLLLQAIQEVEEARKSMVTRNLSLEFRQSELLWELSSASAFLAKDEEGTTGSDAYEMYRARAIAIARKLADNHPGFDKRPQAMFFLGFALMEVGNEADGLSYLRRYVKEYPTHENVPNAYRILADIEFEANRFPAAEALYREILKFPTSAIVGYALYKIGWCNYAMKKHAKAMMGLEQAILWARNMEFTDQLLSLKREAGRDLVSIYAEIGNHKRAYEYFERFLGGGESEKSLAELARELERSGLFEKSNDLYTQLLSLSPTPEERMQYQTAIVYGAYQLRDWKLVYERTQDLIDGFEVVLKTPQEEGTPAYKAERTLNEIVLAQHFEFDEYAKEDDVKRILGIDELYLRGFGKWDSAQMPLYQYAHFLMKYKKVRASAKAFVAHWEQFKEKIKEPVKEESLRNLIHALESEDQEKDTDPLVTQKRVDDILHYTAEYATRYPETKHARPIAFLRTVAMLKHNRVEPGIEESQRLFDKNFTDDFGTRAFKNLRVAYYNLKDWERTFNWASSMLLKPGMESTPYVRDLKTIREESLFLWSDNTKDDLEAARLYTRIAEEPQMQRLRPKALYNAFLRYKEAQKRPEALATAIKLEQAAPNSSELREIAGIRATYYHEAGDFERALPHYESFIQFPPKDTPLDAINQARLAAGLISENLDRAGAAVQLYNSVVASLAEEPSSDPVKEAKRGIERIAERSKRQPASAAKPAFPKWAALLKAKNALEKAPLAPGEALAARIQGGAAKLERTIRQFLEVSGDPTTPPFHAFEAYCAVPFLYGYYQKGIRSLGEGQPEELVVELEKLASPLDNKSLELANQCLTRSSESLHDGPLYRQVLKTWGWMRNPAAAEKAGNLLSLLGGHAPWIEPATDDRNEAQILASHFEGKATPDSWYSLARVRIDRGQLGLARLTLLQSLSDNPDAGRIHNALAVLRQMEGASTDTLDTLYTKAGEKDSMMAWANLGLLHLAGARLDSAREALARAANAGAFEKHRDISSAMAALKDAINTPLPAASNDNAAQPREAR